LKPGMPLAMGGMSMFGAPMAFPGYGSFGAFGGSRSFMAEPRSVRPDGATVARIAVREKTEKTTDLQNQYGMPKQTRAMSIWKWKSKEEAEAEADVLPTVHMTTVVRVKRPNESLWKLVVLSGVMICLTKSKIFLHLRRHFQIDPSESVSIDMTASIGETTKVKTVKTVKTVKAVANSIETVMTRAKAAEKTATRDVLTTVVRAVAVVAMTSVETVMNAKIVTQRRRMTQRREVEVERMTPRREVEVERIVVGAAVKTLAQRKRMPTNRDEAEVGETEAVVHQGAVPRRKKTKKLLQMATTMLTRKLTKVEKRVQKRVQKRKTQTQIEKRVQKRSVKMTVMTTSLSQPSPTRKNSNADASRHLYVDRALMLFSTVCSD